MSYALNSLAKGAAHMAAYPAKKTQPAVAALLLMATNYHLYDYAREHYYGNCEKSKAILDWWIPASAFRLCDLPETGGIYPGGPIPPSRWRELEEQALAFDKGFGLGLREYEHLADIIDTWILEAYSLKGLCEAGPGDIVLDCGAYTGNTVLYFSEKAGPSGRVYAFEADPKHFDTLSQNLAPYANVTPVNLAVNDVSGTVHFSASATTGGMVDAEGVALPAVSIDDFCRDHALPKVDFIKMDIEGGEGAALAGAAETIARHKPRMALSAYHKSTDPYAIPAQILALCPDYRFRLGHFSPGVFELVLYCIPGSEKITGYVESDTDDGAYQPLFQFLENGYARTVATLVQAGRLRTDLSSSTQVAERSLALVERLSAELRGKDKLIAALEKEKLLLEQKLSGK
ncbi:FkbM family methyltransferase [Desulfovibrio sp. OttesenSCG-928-O18]|nr:FkbM family methyltransferase [Desulfovibrio sp. OttesenSCG-928-O18]